VIEAIAVLGHSVFVIVGLMRRRHDAVLELQMLELIRLEQRVRRAENGRH
jgi:hypothetical protein